MKDKIIAALKQKYSYTGLGEDIFSQFAEVLLSVVTVTDENLSEMVDKQKGALEAIQKANDKRATDAVAKAKAEAEKAAKEKAEKEKAEKAAKEKAEAEKKAKEDAEKRKKEEEEKKKMGNKENKVEEKPDWFRQYEEQMAAQLKSVNSANETLKAQLKKVSDENEEYRTKQKETERANFIASKAKELGVPEWREKEGFVITSDMDNDAITTYLTTVANNAKAKDLPSEDNPFPKSDGKPTTEEINNIVNKLSI